MLASSNVQGFLLDITPFSSYCEMDDIINYDLNLLVSF
jgi:hypothetical protein